MSRGNVSKMMLKTVQIKNNSPMKKCLFHFEKKSFETKKKLLDVTTLFPIGHSRRDMVVPSKTVPSNFCLKHSGASRALIF